MQYKMELIARMCVMAALLGFGIAQLTKMEKALVLNRLLRLQDQQDIMRRHSQVVESGHQQSEDENDKRSIKWDNNLNRPLRVDCDTEQGEALVRVRSRFSKKDDDRQFKWDCSGVTEGKMALTDCEWSKEVNKQSGPISFICPKNKVMAGVKSKTHESKGDRKWRVKCCKARGHITKSCGVSERLNSYRGNIDYKASLEGAEPSVFVGIQSLENPKNDHVWQVFECNFGRPKCTQETQNMPFSNHRKPPNHPPSDHHSYNIILDMKKPRPPLSSEPKSHTYTAYPSPTTDDGDYTIEVDPMRGDRKVNKMTHIVQKDESLVNRKRNRPPRLLPVPPGTSKHPDLSSKHGKKSATTSPSSNGHVIEIIPHFDSSHRVNEHSPPYSLQYKQTIPKQPHERHIHIYPPQGNTPGLFTVYPRPDMGAPKIRYTEPPKPPQRTHYHVRLPSDKSKMPADLHYDVPIPGANKGESEMKYSVPLNTPNAKGRQNVQENTIEGLLRELAIKGSHKRTD